jgi:predicted Zn-dependent peptidase
MTHKIILKNGIPVVMHQMMHAHSVSIGLYVAAGTVHEDKFSKGISHVIEHMLFKGTESMTAARIAQEIDSLGGEINAYTSKECTGIYAKVLPEDIAIPIEIISDMVLHSLFDSAELEKEKSVIIEEIKSYEDTPDELNYDLLSEVIYRGTSLVNPILGDEDSVKAVTRQEIMTYMENHYTADRMVISVAGRFDSETVGKLLESAFGTIKPVSTKKVYPPISTEIQTGYSFRHKEFEQTHIDFAFWGPPAEDTMYYAAHIANNIIAGAMSSRLFQRLREDLGLVYTIYSQISSYEHTGNMTVGMSVSEENINQAVQTVLEELKLLRTEGITEEEFLQSRKHLMGSVQISTETSDQYMSLMAKDLLFGRELEEVEDIVNKIRRTTYSDTQSTLKLIFEKEKAVSAVGKISKSIIMDIYAKMIKILED